MKEATAKKEQRLESLLKEAESSPAIQAVRAQRAAEILAKRQEAAGKIAALRNEATVIIPKRQSEIEALEGEYRAAKKALDELGSKCQELTLELRRDRLVSDYTIQAAESVLIETADPRIDETIQFFTEKLDTLRTPGRISINRLGAERNIFTEKVRTRVESNHDAVIAALRYCMDAVLELQQMRIDPVLDVEKIERMKAGIPDINTYSEIKGERPFPKTAADVNPRDLLKSDSQIEWEIRKLLEKVKKVMAPKPAIPTPAKKRAEPGKHWIETRYK